MSGKARFTLPALFPGLAQGDVSGALKEAGVNWIVNDNALRSQPKRLPFERWCEVVSVDVEASAHAH